jgi:hypothetical protein
MNLNAYVAKKSIMLDVVKVDVVMSNVVMSNVVMSNVVMSNVVMSNVVMSNVVMSNVVASFFFDEKKLKQNSRQTKKIIGAEQGTLAEREGSVQLTSSLN